MSDASEIIKSGAFNQIADIFHKLAGPMADELGHMMGEKVRYYRAKNSIELFKKTQAILLRAGRLPNAVPSRVLIPLLESASLEDSEIVQNMWAELLANASQGEYSISPSFIETLKQLRPMEASVLRGIFLDEGEKVQVCFAIQGDAGSAGAQTSDGCLVEAPPAEIPLMTDAFERLGLAKYSHRTLSDGIPGRGFIRLVESQTRFMTNEQNNDTRVFDFTTYGKLFLKACIERKA